MRQVIVSNLVSIDGFFEGPSGELDWHVVDEEFLAYAKGLLRDTGALLFGRRTYEHMAAYWQTAPSDEIADAMNDLPKIVFSKTLSRVPWRNSRLVSGDAAREAARLRSGEGGDLVILGSARLVSFLLSRGLIDEYRMIVNPLILGRGRPQLEGITERISARLARTKTLASGVIVLYYRFGNG